MSTSSSPDDASSHFIADSLTDRQQEIACLVAQGLTEGQIADRLYLSRATIHEHVRHIYERLEVHRRAELVAAVIRSGLCDSPK